MPTLAKSSDLGSKLALRSLDCKRISQLQVVIATICSPMRKLLRNVRNQPWLTTVLLVACVTRALIPLGFMPGPAGIVICHGYGNQIDTRDLQLQLLADEWSSSGVPDDPPNQHGNHDTPICPFAAAAGSIAVPPPVLPGAQLSHLLAIGIPVPPGRAIPRTLKASSLLPRGPPVPNLIVV